MSFIPIRIKRGLSSNLPATLAEGELAVTTDTHKLYVGTGTSRVLLNPEAQSSPEADRLSTARLIQLAGDATGNTSFDGSQDVTINVSLAEELKQKINKVDTLGTAATLNTGTTSGTIPVIGSDNKLASSILPALAITSTTVVNSQEEMLALQAQEGDIAIRTDLTESYILTKEPATELSNWQKLLTKSEVISVNGQTGAVVLTVTNIEGAAPSNNPTFTGTVTVPEPSSEDASTKPATTNWIKTKLEALKGSQTPQALGVAAVGTSNSYAREDHVHPLPEVIDGGVF